MLYPTVVEQIHFWIYVIVIVIHGTRVAIDGILDLRHHIAAAR